MSRIVCAHCGRQRPLDWHHLTARCKPGSPYLDPALTVPLCRSCHATEHAIVRMAGFEWAGTTDEVMIVRYRIIRVADHVGRLARAGRPFTLAPPAGEGLHNLLLDGVLAIEELRKGITT